MITRHQDAAGDHNRVQKVECDLVVGRQAGDLRQRCAVVGAKPIKQGAEPVQNCLLLLGLRNARLELLFMILELREE